MQSSILSFMSRKRKAPDEDEEEQRKKPEKRDRRAGYLEYEEEKRDRKFKKEWCQGREWLQHDDNHGMLCSDCKEYYAKYPDPKRENVSWTKGTKNYRLQSVKEHENSKMHLKAVGALRAQAAKPGETVAEKSVLKLKEDIAKKLVPMFRNVHALAKECRPMRDFLWLTKLDIAKGVKISESYQTTFSAKTFMTFIAKDVREKVAEHVQQAKFLAVTCDGATDVASMEQEGTCIRFCMKGQLFVKFAGVSAPLQADAPGILKCIIESLEGIGLTEDTLKSKLVGLGSDGASVMLGKNNGVASLLRKIQPALVSVHCMAHRTELSFRDATKNVGLYDKCITLLLGLYLFYKQSYRQRNLLKQCYETYAKKQMIPTRVGGTRWVGHTLKAINILLHGYDVIHAQLEDTLHQSGGTADMKNKARGYLRLMTSRDVLTFVLFLRDVLLPLNKLSLILQERYSTVADTFLSITSAQAVIKKYATR